VDAEGHDGLVGVAERHAVAGDRDAALAAGPAEALRLRRTSERERADGEERRGQQAQRPGGGESGDGGGGDGLVGSMHGGASLAALARFCAHAAVSWVERAFTGG